MWQHRLAVLRRCPVRSDGDDDVRAGAERVIKVKVAGRRLRDGIDLHASHVCRRAGRDRRLHGARVVPVHLHRRARVEVPVVHGVLGYHRREHEELARSGNCCLLSRTKTQVNLNISDHDFVMACDEGQTGVKAKEMPDEQRGHRRLVIIPG